MSGRCKTCGRQVLRPPRFCPSCGSYVLPDEQPVVASTNDVAANITAALTYVPPRSAKGTDVAAPAIPQDLPYRFGKVHGLLGVIAGLVVVLRTIMQFQLPIVGEERPDFTDALLGLAFGGFLIWSSLGIFRRKRGTIFVANTLLIGAAAASYLLLLFVAPVWYYYYKRMDEFE